MATEPLPPPADDPGTPRPPAAFVAMRPGPQAHNRVAGTLEAQFASVFVPRPKPARREAESAELAKLRREVNFLIRRIYGERRDGGRA